MGTFFLLCLTICFIAFFLAIFGPAFHDLRASIPRPSKIRGGRDLLDRIARRFKGSVVTQDVRNPYASVLIQGRYYRVQLCRSKFKDSREFICISASWKPTPIRNIESSNPDTGEPAPNFRVSITPTRTWEGLKGIQDVEIGNLFFDTRFVIQSNDQEILLDTLTKQCQILINTIYSQYYERQFELRIVGGELQLDSYFQISRPGKTFLIIRTFAELHRELLAANEVAYSVDVDTIRLSGETTCLICGELVSEKSVKCRSCNTEYHEDCWQYLGSCGRYACGEKEFSRTHYEDNSETYRIE